MSNGARYDLLDNATGNGSDTVVKNGGKYQFTSSLQSGSYGTVTLQMKDANDNYVAVGGGAHSADGTLLVEIPSGTYRAVGATATVDAFLIKV